MKTYNSGKTLPPDLRKQAKCLMQAADVAKAILIDKGHKDILHQLCMPIATLMCAVLGSAHLPARMVAGSAYWRMLSLEEIGDLLLQDVPSSEIVEDFGYQFDESLTASQMLALLADCDVPEMHAWVEVPSPITGSILIFDPTLGYQPKQMTEILKVPFRGKPLDEYLYGDYESVKEAGYVYTKSQKATELAEAFVMSKQFAKSLNLDW